MRSVLRLERIMLICDDLRATARFYEQALGFTSTGGRTTDEPALGQLLGISGARAQWVALHLGDDRIDLVRIDPGGRAYPPDVPGNSGLFQHFAIEVPDMTAAMNRLATSTVWSEISVDGPQTLPPASGSATAFKFRDPEGHPLELISAARRAPDGAARIAHSALSVASSARSISFYAGLGLAQTGGSVNTGVEQERLDAVSNARVEVSALRVPGASGPGVELLCYTDRFERPASALQPTDIAAVWLVFTVRDEADLQALLLQLDHETPPTRFADGTLRSLVRDPDGHCLCLEVPAA